MSDWMLVFSDGTGQRGVREDAGFKNTNVFTLYAAVDGQPGFQAFYDPGLGAPEEGDPDAWRWWRNLWSKATGWGITANIVDCYEALMMQWRPGMRIGLFGFSRGAYTVRCLGGALGISGIATRVNGGPVPMDKDGPKAEARRKVAQAAVDAYKIEDEAKRLAAGRAFRQANASADVMPDVVGVFDTVRALGLPGVMDVVNPFRHVFHDQKLSPRVPVGLQALSIDENRKVFANVTWDDPTAPGQRIEQCWMPGNHSDIGGGYEKRALADLSLAWMIDRLKVHCDLRVPLTVELREGILGPQHEERTGFGTLYLPGERAIRSLSRDVDLLHDAIEKRFDSAALRYRPSSLRSHPRVRRYYAG